LRRDPDPARSAGRHRLIMPIACAAACKSRQWLVRPCLRIPSVERRPPSSDLAHRQVGEYGTSQSTSS
jgi:hypothetical protein